MFRGEDVTSFKALGGRLGVRSGNEQLKFGVSATYDKDNRRQSTARSISRIPGVNIPALGDVPRMRLGADLSLYLGDFSFEGEYIKLLHDLGGTSFPEISLDKQFYYVNGMYESIDRWFAYAGYSYTNNEAYEASQPNSVDKAGVYSATSGGGYRVSYQATAKLQYQRYFLDTVHSRSPKNTIKLA